MVSQRAISFEADLDISDVMRGLNRIERQARSVGGTVGRVGGGLGRAGGSVGRTVGAGAGIGAGAAVFEMLIQRIFELFEGTPVLETFTMALDTLFQAFGPVIGVLLESLTPVIVALTPAIEPLARALTPLIQLLGTQLLVAVELVTPGIVLVAEGAGAGYDGYSAGRVGRHSVRGRAAKQIALRGHSGRFGSYRRQFRRDGVADSERRE